MARCSRGVRRRALLKAFHTIYTNIIKSCTLRRKMVDLREVILQGRLPGSFALSVRPLYYGYMTVRAAV